MSSHDHSSNECRFVSSRIQNAASEHSIMDEEEDSIFPPVDQRALEDVSDALRKSCLGSATAHTYTILRGVKLVSVCACVCVYCVKTAPLTGRKYTSNTQTAFTTHTLQTAGRYKCSCWPRVLRGCTGGRPEQRRRGRGDAWRRALGGGRSFQVGYRATRLAHQKTRG